MTSSFHLFVQKPVRCALLVFLAGTSLGPVSAAATTTITEGGASTMAVATVPSSKQVLIDKLLTLWHPETVALVMVQRPAADAVQQSRIALQGRVSAAKQEATMKAITAEAQRYVDDATPLAQAAANRGVSAAAGPVLAQNFSEDELRQLIAMWQSPLKARFEQLVPQMERAVGERVAEAAGATIQGKLDAMKSAIGLKLRAASMAP
jgi:hypothetical protein